MIKKYEEYLKKKVNVAMPSGFDTPLKKLNPMLFDWQAILTKWAIARGRAALFEDCGLGKTCQLLEWSKQIHKKEKEPILILAPLAVSEQTQREGKKFGIDVNICVNDSDVINGINITNYEKLHKFDPDRFVGIVLDECFSPDTPIDVFNIDNSLGSKYIKDVTIGDKIYNAGGIDHVYNICKRPIDRAVQIRIKGRPFTCSEHHPWFTLHGWRFAKDLQPEDCLMATEETMRLVRGDFSSKICGEQNGEVLRDILLSEMEDEYSRTQSKSTYPRDSGQKGNFEIKMASKRRSQSDKRNGSNSQFKSNVKSQNNRKNDSNQNSQRNISAMERKKGRQRSTILNPATNNDRMPVKKMDSRISNFFRKKATWISNLLQSGCRKSNSKNSNRNRWGRTREQKSTNYRQKERSKIDIFRVESIEILEQGHPELEKYRDESGIVYFYDIEAERHPSFSVNGCLVHNSSILKNFSGAIRNEIIGSFQKTKYRLACTATPAPNDYMELGNHSEFLGVMTRSEMLSTFFINDTDKVGHWRLKGHVKNNIFWKWMASWAIMINKPSDIGFDNSGFELPEIEYHEHIIKSDAKPTEGLLLLQTASTLDERRKVRRETVEIRCQTAADIINPTDSRWVCWVNLNPEGEAITKKVNYAKEVAGRHSNDIKIQRMIGFASGDLKRIATKPKIAGLGMNWQVCNKAAFIGLSDSWEQFYQAVRRIWRFGQKEKVDIHIFIEEREGSVLKNIRRKDKQAKLMTENMINHTKDFAKIELEQSKKTFIDYSPTKKMRLPKWITG